MTKRVEFDVARAILEVSQSVAEGYRDAESAECAIAASNTGFFILQELGFTFDEIRRMLHD
jgi:hypothetical protein